MSRTECPDYRLEPPDLPEIPNPDWWDEEEDRIYQMFADRRYEA